MQPRALLIDAMGTLVRLVDPVPRLAAVLRDRAGVEITEAQAGRALRAEIAHYHAHLLEGRDDAGVAALRAGCAVVLRDALPAHAAAGLDAGAATGVLLDTLRFAPFADAREALVRARRAGARVIAVSNWDVSLAEVLERAGLAPLLDGVVTSAAVGAAKPAPAIFVHARALAGAAAADCVHVGDSLAEDVAGARAVGIEPVLLDRGGDVLASDDVRVIASLDELSS